MTGILRTSAPAGVPGPGSLAVRPAGAAAPSVTTPAAVCPGTGVPTPAAVCPGTGVPTGRRRRLGAAVVGGPGTRRATGFALPVHPETFRNDATTLGIHSPGRPLS